MFGSLCAIGSEPGKFDERDVKILEKVAGFLSYVIELENQSIYDSLTGVYNRRYLYAYQMERPRKGETTILFLDLDNFKAMNDTYGHEAGDRILKEVGKRLKSSVRSGDGFVARLGGDEFIVTLEGCEDQNEVVGLAQSILDEMAKPLVLDGNEVCLSASIGISVLPENSDDLEGFIHHADTALYKAKRSGKNRFCFYKEELI